MHTHIFNVSAILSVDNIKNTNVFFFLFFLFSLNWEREREYVIAILRKIVGRNSFKVYLAFRQRVSSESIFSFMGSGILYSSAWMHLSSCPWALCRFSTRSLAWDSPICSWWSLSWNPIFFIPISADEKRVLLPL